MKKFASLLVLAAVTTLASCKGKEKEPEVIEEPLATYTPPELLGGTFTLTEGSTIENIPEQTYLMGAVPRMMQIKNSDGLATFIGEITELGFDVNEFIILYHSAHKTLDALRYSFVQSLITGQTQEAEHVLELLTAPIKPSIADEINVELEHTASPTSEDGTGMTLKIDQDYTLPDCNFGDDSCNIHLDINTSLDFPWPQPTISSVGSGHSLKIENATPSITKFIVSNQNASLELELIYSYIGQYEATIPNESDNIRVRVRNLETSQIRADLMVTYTNKTTKDDGSQGEIKVTGSFIGSFTMNNLDTNFDEDTITARVVDSIARLKLEAYVIE